MRAVRAAAGARRARFLVLAVCGTGIAALAAAVGGSTGALVGASLALLAAGAAALVAGAESEPGPVRSPGLETGGRDPEARPADGVEDARGAAPATPGELAERLRSITAERSRLETTLASIEEGVVAVDPSGTVLQMNGAAARFLRANLGAALGVPFAQVCHHDETGDLVRLALTSGRFQKRQSVVEGTVLDCYATPLGEGAGVVLVLHDITEVRRLEGVRRDFVANVSHELKTPLTAIKGYVETLLEGGLDDRENNLRFLRKIDAHANRLTTLITDLLSLSRIESGEAVKRKVAVDVGEVLAASMARLGPGAEKKGLRFGARELQPGLGILGDPEALNQIFDNLIDNAIKYTEAGGRVELSLVREDRKVVFEVKDSGVGIPEEDLPRIFERFYRVDKARSRELGGTGLGLSIVRHLVNALDGEIRVRSTPGVGSVFTVLFPAYEEEEGIGGR